MVKVVVYDDNQNRRESLQALVAMSPELGWAGGFANCNEVKDDMRRTQPDLVLMDIEMPGTDGLDGVKLIKQYFPAVKIIMQTAFDDDDKIFTALQYGAEGYILKTASVTQLLQSIDEVMKGGAAMTPSIALKVMRYFNSKVSSDKAASYNLSPKESEVLKHLAEGLSYKMVADKMGISYFTVNNHVKKVYEKLQVNSLGEAVALAHRNRLV